VNYFAHALPFLDDPYFVAGTAVPDWLSVIDRRLRVKAKHAAPFADHPLPETAAVARGVLQHIRDDAQFHRTRAFAECTLGLSASIRGMMPDDASFRPSFLAHVLVEVLLDWTLAEDRPGGLDDYYRALESLDLGTVAGAVNCLAAGGGDRLASLIPLFRRERILSDYGRDDKLNDRMNQVMRRVGFCPLPESVREVFPVARQLVRRRQHELMEGIPVR
jgi:hypothetical protein